MINLNVEFQEEYKRLDALCKDIFCSKEGISEYIRTMESVSPNDIRFAPTWKTDYKQLKHLRWVRNQLAHEVGAFEQELCTSSDIDWLKDFYRRIMTVRDPLAVIGEAKEAEQRQVQNHKPVSEKSIQKRKKCSLSWSGIIEKIKKIFFH